MKLNVAEKSVEQSELNLKQTHTNVEIWEYLARAIPKLKEASQKAKKVVGYFNNHYHGYAPENCLRLIERLGLLSEEQKKMKEKTSKKQSKLQGFSNLR